MSDHKDTTLPASDPTALVITANNPGARHPCPGPHFLTIFPWSAAPIPTHWARGRSCKYNTPDEQAAAHALSQQGYYERCISFAYGLAAH